MFNVSMSSEPLPGFPSAAKKQSHWCIMLLIQLQDALKSSDIDIKMVAGRASRFRVFGSPDRVPDDRLLIADLRDGDDPSGLAEEYKVLDRHPMAAILLVRRL